MACQVENIFSKLFVCCFIKDNNKKSYTFSCVICVNFKKKNIFPHLFCINKEIKQNIFYLLIAMIQRCQSMYRTKRLSLKEVYEKDIKIGHTSVFLFGCSISFGISVTLLHLDRKVVSCILHFLYLPAEPAVIFKKPTEHFT